MAPYLNERNKQPKQYELPLEKCPDPNARLTFALTATIGHEVSIDNISNASGQTVNIETIVGTQNLTESSTDSLTQLFEIATIWFQQKIYRLLLERKNGVNLPILKETFRPEKTILLKE